MFFIQVEFKFIEFFSQNIKLLAVLSFNAFPLINQWVWRVWGVGGVGWCVVCGVWGVGCWGCGGVGGVGRSVGTPTFRRNFYVP